MRGQGHSRAGSVGHAAGHHNHWRLLHRNGFARRHWIACGSFRGLDGQLLCFIRRWQHGFDAHSEAQHSRNAYYHQSEDHSHRRWADRDRYVVDPGYTGSRDHIHAFSPATINMSSMATTSLTATAAPVGGVSLTANAAIFKVTGLPAGITGSWGTTALTAAGTLQAKLTLTGSTSAISSATKPAIAVSVTDSVTGKVYSASATATSTDCDASSANPGAQPRRDKWSRWCRVRPGTLQITTTTGGSYSGLVTLGRNRDSRPVLPPPGRAGPLLHRHGGFGSTTSTLTLKAATTAAVASTAVKITATGDGVAALASDTVQVWRLRAIAMALSPTSINMQVDGHAGVDCDGDAGRRRFPGSQCRQLQCDRAACCRHLGELGRAQAGQQPAARRSSR